MASSKKRKADAEPDGNLEEALPQTKLAATSDKPTVKRRRTSRKKKEIRVPSEDLFKKLPGELRNQIYEWAMVEKDGYRMEKKCWTPELLSVSKQIRREAISIFFSINRMTLVWRSEDLPKASAWLKRTCELCGGWPFHSETKIRIFVQEWSTITYWVSFSRIIFDLPLSFVDRTAEAMHWLSVLLIGGGKNRLRWAFQEAIMLGVKAKHRGNSLAHLDEDLRDWIWGKEKCQTATLEYLSGRDRSIRAIGLPVTLMRGLLDQPRMPAPTVSTPAIS